MKVMMNAALLVAQGVQDEEFLYPYYRLQEAEFDLSVVFVDHPKYNKCMGKYGIPFLFNYTIDEVIDEQYDIVIIPGGLQGPEIMRMNTNVLRFVQKNYQAESIIAAICHGPQVLISADIIREKRLTGFLGIKDDIINAGGTYIDKEIVIDGNLITSPHYKHNPIFMKTILEKFEYRRHEL